MASNDNTAYGRYLASQGPRGFRAGMAAKTFAPIGVAMAAPAIGSLLGFGGAPAAASAPTFGLGAANTGAWATSLPALSAGGSTVAPSAGFSIGKLFGSKGAELAAGVGTTLLGQRSANKSQREANALTERTTNAQLALAERDAARELEARTLDRSDNQRRWEAEEAFRAKQFAASEEERLHARKLADELEARRAPRREMSRQALQQVGRLLGWT